MAWRWRDSVGGATVAAALAIVSCAIQYSGAVDASGYSNPTYELRVQPLRDGRLLPDQWRLDNLYDRGGGTLVPKESADYEVTHELDVDGDGTYETIRVEHAYELRFEHRENRGLIWLRVVPISQTKRAWEPRVLIRDYVDAIAGVGYEVTTLTGDDEERRQQRRYAAEVVESYTGMFAGAPAHARWHRGPSRRPATRRLMAAFETRTPEGRNSHTLPRPAGHRRFQSPLRAA